VLPAGPVAPGTYDWDELLGSECLDPWLSPWDEEFTVVDCAAPHTAQLVARGVFADDAAAAWPGLAELQSRMNLLCTSTTVIDYAAAGTMSDIQVSASYPATDAEWAAGDHTYYCFVSRAGVEPLTGSVAVATAP
jgi:hypothetical protein